MSSSNLIYIFTEKTRLRQVSGESFHWFNHFLSGQLKGVHSLCLLPISYKLRQVEGVCDVKNRKKSKILIDKKISALTLATFMFRLEIR